MPIALYFEAARSACAASSPKLAPWRPARFGGNPPTTVPHRGHVGAVALPHQRPAAAGLRPTSCAVSPTPAPSGERRPRLDYTKQWWPVAPAADIVEGHSLVRTVMDQEMLMRRERDGAGAWKVVAYRNACPHFNAPLSEGSDIDGDLRCNLHGQVFGAAGRCIYVPEATLEELPRILASERSCLTHYPCTTADGAVWIWPIPRDEENAAAASLPALPSVSGPAFITSFTLPLPWDVLASNLVDGAHVPHAHSGVPPYDHTKRPPTNYRDVTPPHQPASAGFTVVSGAQPQGGAPHGSPGESSQLSYVAPLGPVYKVSRGAMAFFVTPSTAYATLVTVISRFEGPTWVGRLLPRWFVHKILNDTFDGDTGILQHVARSLDPDKSIRGQSYLSSRADLPLSKFLKWADDNGKPMLKPSWVPVDAIDARDRWTRHSRDCPCCRGALNNMQRASKVCGALFPVLLAAATMGGEAPLPPPPALAAAAVLAKGGQALLDSLSEDWFRKRKVYKRPL